MNILYRKWRSLLFKIRYRLAIFNDWRNGVDFTAPVSKEEAGTSNNDEALYYASSGYVPEIKMALDYLRITKEDSIIDYGCGKGAVFVTFCRYPFKRIAGIELSVALSTIAVQNMDKLKLSNVKIITGDATQYIDIDGVNFFYFFNPFSGQVFDMVINNIVQSLSKNPRQVAILYYHPKCHDSIMSTGKFLLIKEFVDGHRRLYIYKNTQI